MLLKQIVSRDFAALNLSYLKTKCKIHLKIADNIKDKEGRLLQQFRIRSIPVGGGSQLSCRLNRISEESIQALVS